MSSSTMASLLTLPSELRNAIYLYIFTPETDNANIPAYNEPWDAIATALKLRQSYAPLEPGPCTSRDLHLLQTCRQIHNEANRLALSMTAFHITGQSSHPDCFAERMLLLRDTKVNAIRHLTLTAKLSHLRALNEAWGGLPFGSPLLSLETLTIVPYRQDVCHTAYADFADQAQCSTLAHVLAETFKRLRNVRVVQVRNHGFFNERMWMNLYGNLIYRLWKWGGDRCGVSFQCCDETEDRGQEWFKIWLKDDEGGGKEAGDEVSKLVRRGELPDHLAGF